MSTVIPGMRSADHMGFVVPDLDEAVSFFVRVLGAKPVFRIASISDADGDSMTRKVGVHPRATVRGAMLRFGPATNVEFLQYDVPGQAKAPQEVSDMGAAHSAVFVDDINAAAGCVPSPGSLGSAKPAPSPSTSPTPAWSTSSAPPVGGSSSSW